MQQLKQELEILENLYYELRQDFYNHTIQQDKDIENIKSECMQKIKELEEHIGRLQIDLNNLYDPTYKFFNTVKESDYDDEVQEAFDKTLNKQLSELIKQKYDKLKWRYQVFPYYNTIYFEPYFIAEICVENVYYKILVQKEYFAIYLEDNLIYDEIFNLFDKLYSKLNINKQQIVNVLKQL